MGHVACMREMRNVYKILVEHLKGRANLKDLGVDGMMILEWIYRNKVDAVDWTHLAQDTDKCEHGYEPLEYIK
jgi:hypothetical protein